MVEPEIVEATNCLQEKHFCRYRVNSIICKQLSLCPEFELRTVLYVILGKAIKNLLADYTKKSTKVKRVFSLVCMFILHSCET